MLIRKSRVSLNLCFNGSDSGPIPSLLGLVGDLIVVINLLCSIGGSNRAITEFYNIRDEYDEYCRANRNCEEAP